MNRNHFVHRDIFGLKQSPHFVIIHAVVIFVHPPLTLPSRGESTSQLEPCWTNKFLCGANPGEPKSFSSEVWKTETLMLWNNSTP